MNRIDVSSIFPWRAQRVPRQMSTKDRDLFDVRIMAGHSDDNVEIGQARVARVRVGEGLQPR